MQKYLLAISLGLLSLCLGFFIAGAGHGWITGFYFSLISLVAYPFLKYYLLNQNKCKGLFIFSLNIMLTILMYFTTKEEGNEYFAKMFQGLPLLMILYFILWFGWGFQGLFTFIKSKK